MTQLEEAISRYNKLIEAGPFRDLSWVQALHQRMEAERLTAGGRLLCPFLRPNFVSRRQYDTLARTSEALQSAIYRMQKIALASPALLARIQLLPAEKMLASIEPGYDPFEAASRFDFRLTNGTLRAVDYTADSPSGVAYAEGLAELFYDCPPVREFRKRYGLKRVGGKKAFLAALLKVYKQFGGQKKPNIAIVEFRSGLAGSQTEYDLFRDFFRQEGFAAEVISPEQLEYRNGVLHAAAFPINLVYRRVGVQEFLMRFDLSHPLVQAYRDRAVCVVNSFRAELGQKRAMFALLTDEELTAGFPAEERHAIRDHVPWTRIVAPGKTKYGRRTVDLLQFISEHRVRLALKPNDEGSDQHIAIGANMDQAAWERAIRQALRAPYVVQEKVEASSSVFPMMAWGHLEFREMSVDVHPQTFLGKMAGCSSWLSAGGPGAYSTAAGLTPTFLLEPKA